MGSIIKKGDFALLYKTKPSLPASIDFELIYPAVAEAKINSIFRLKCGIVTTSASTFFRLHLPLKIKAEKRVKHALSFDSFCVDLG